MPSRGSLALAVTLVLCLAGCGDDTNTLLGVAATQPPSASAVLYFTSSSWAGAPGKTRELMAVDLEGTRVERLTSCTSDEDPCDMLQVAPSAQRGRVAVVRSTASAQEGVSALYFMDLNRSVQQLIQSRRRVTWVDWSPTDAFLLYVATGDQNEQEDLFYCLPDGSEDENLTQTRDVRERSPRIIPNGQTALFERIGQDGAGRIYLYADTAVTTGPAAGPTLPGTPYVVGGDADPVLSPDGEVIAFRRLTGLGNGGLGTWDLMTYTVDTTSYAVVATGPLFRGAPDWSTRGLVFVETDAAANVSNMVTMKGDGTERRVILSEPADYGMQSPRWIRP
jgi:Tol biopolymer transport system component